MLTVPEIAQRLGLTTGQVYRRLARGDMPSTMGGIRRQQYFVKPEDLQAYIDAGQPLTVPRRDRSMMSVPEVSRATGFTDETVRKLCYEGRLGYVRGPGANGHLRIQRDSVEQYLSMYSAVS